MNAWTRDDASRQRLGGVAALYLALALLVAMPYFLLVVDYPGATTAAEKVAMVVGHYPSMYAMYVATYMVFGIALALLVLVLHGRLRSGAPFLEQLVTAAGLLWAVALVMSGMVFTYGMTAIVALARTDAAQAVIAWRAIEPVALAVGGAGGEFLGGLWALLLGWWALRGGDLPKALGALGVVVGVVGLASVVPPLHDAAIAFGLLQIGWFGWLGVFLLTTRANVAVSAPATARLA